MKFLAGLVHVAVASKVVFDSNDPALRAWSDFITKNHGGAVRFRSPPTADDASAPDGRIVDHVAFSMDTSEVPRNSWLRVTICPSVKGLPDCTESNFERIAIVNFAEQFNKWTPASSIVLASSNLYYCTVFSNTEGDVKSPHWLAGAMKFNNESDPITTS
ncbi:hypothetical protein H310_14695 [Aphanomyces invadans]|uniref:Uncharacterized protein n=1 Tax=Aphanomyces invadans TaxID=157072 RepID=A0A024T8P2_9STRA|nr:hypothetical protein H310_14695 [Aphanomyces invadans]ETV90505.1 hypothetical protein H310_14695 [Aphanomyces invadans]|eukprot:XP_008880821.1 hypothetical protein H310_14695 [Aphanomyces invadans]